MTIATKSPRELAKLSGAMSSKQVQQFRGTYKLHDRQSESTVEPEPAVDKRKSKNFQLLCISRNSHSRRNSNIFLAGHAKFVEKEQYWNYDFLAYNELLRIPHEDYESVPIFDPSGILIGIVCSLTESTPAEENWVTAWDYLGSEIVADEIRNFVWDHATWDWAGNTARIAFGGTSRNEVSKSDSETTIEAELISINEEGAQCWMEVVKGMRVRATIPIQAIQELPLTSGDEFLWDTKGKRAILKSKPVLESAERQRLRQSLKALSDEFRQGLSNRPECSE